MVFTLLATTALLLLVVPLQAEKSPPIKVLFLGDRGHHRPAERFRQLQPVLAQRGIDLTYTEKVEALNAGTLASYDGLMIYANIEKISPEQEHALLEFVEKGKGLIALHCASYCFLNSQKYIALVGAQFQRHGTGEFRTQLAAPDHPLMKDFHSFASWDETYVHHRHNDKDRIVLETRAEGANKEPWTWVRTQGKGRVFYTAWGHDERTWSNPGFHNLVERGIRWAVGKDPGVVPAFRDRPAMTAKRTDVTPFEYVEANVPFYPPSPKWGVMGENIRKMQKPVAPAESLKHMVVPVDFEVKLFASEPNLGGKPICMNWDERGRLWVAVTVDYPNELQPAGKGRDRIVICEDTDGDGVADKFTVFADGLSIPTSLTFARGGAIVHQAPHTLFLKDTDGDDKADVRQVLFTGWATNDTHAGPNNLVQGLDNWIHGMVGYAGFEGTVGTEKHSFRQGFYRFRPDGLKLEFLRNTNNNSWGLGFGEDGSLFGSTANGNPSVHLPIPNRYYEAVRGWSSSVLGGIAGNAPIEPITDRVRQMDQHGHFTAAAGHALYTARTYPREYWNRTAFVSEPTAHLLATFEIQPDGASYRSRNAWNMLASDDEWTSPVMAEVGPDGHVWMIDWYSYIIQHNPTPPGFKTGKGNAYETDLRDHKHGRIYRLVYKKAPPTVNPSLKDASPEKLVATLRHDNLFWRRHAQRLLVERGQKDVVPALIKLVADDSIDAICLNPGAIHALWTLHGLNAINGSEPAATASAIAALHHRSAGVRRNAASVLPPSADSAQAILDAGLLPDGDAQVRLAALLALAEMPANAKAGAAIAAVLHRSENANDRWLVDAVTAAAARNAPFFLQNLANAKRPPSVPVVPVIAIVAEHFARGAPVDSAAPLLASLENASPALAEVVVAAFAKAWPANRPANLTPETEQALVRLLARLSPGAKGQLIKLARLWQSKGFEKHAVEAMQALVADLENEKLPDDRRLAAARQLVEFQPTDPLTVEKVLEVISPRNAPRLTLGLLEALDTSRAANLGSALVAKFAGWSPSARAAALRLLLARPESTRALIDGLENGKVHQSDLALDQKQALMVHPDAKIADRAKLVLERGGSLPSADRTKVLDELMPLTRKTGDAAAGKVVFTKFCATCHMHGGEGQKIGPDLTGMAVHSREHLLTDILDPSRSVEGNYRVYNVETTDGRVLTGLLASETKTTIELIDAQAKKQVVLRENIDRLTATTKSLMPEGFEKQMSPDQLVNLLEFLTQRGRFLPLPLAKAATAVTTRGMFISPDSDAERLIFEDWQPKIFQGVPFQLVDPRGDRVPNAVMLFGPQGALSSKMPRSVNVPCNSTAKTIHLLSGVSGWGYPVGEKGTVSMIVRLHYADGKTEEHPLRNGIHFADYIRVVDVPGSKLAFKLRGQQIRYLTITPERDTAIDHIELAKGPDASAPVVMAITVERAE